MPDVNTVWFVALSFMLTGYAVLDGFDLGVGVLHFFVGRTSAERATAIDAIGPVWNGNEVWLLAAGGSMVVAFPHVYASAFSGFYLALMLVLWLLLLRGIAIEFRHQLNHPMWHDFWDVVFSGASTLLAVLFGVAVGNVLRGVPLDANGEFQGTFTLMLNPFALLGGVLSVAVLSLHGSAWLAVKTDGPVQARARRLAGPLWWAAVLLLGAMVAASFAVRPDFTRNFARWPSLMVVPAFTVGGAVAFRVFRRRQDDGRAFAASATMIAGTLGGAAAGLFPYLLLPLPGSTHPGLDIYNSASAGSSLRIALGVYLFGMTLVIAYLAHAYWIWRGKVERVYH